MFGIIVSTDKKSIMYRDTRADFQLVKLELSDETRHAKRWIRKLAKCGVSSVAVSNKLFSRLGQIMENCGITPVAGDELLLRLGARIALSALCHNNISFENTGAEIYSGDAYVFDAVSFCSEEMRYVSVCGRGSERFARKANEELGISVISGEIPAGLCDNVLRLYFDGRCELFEIKTKTGTLKFEKADIVLPQKFSMLCDKENVFGFAEILVRSGKLMLSQVEIGNVLLSNC